MTLIPFPGRDYKNKKDLMTDWEANKDFHTADIITGYGRATNKRELEALGMAHGITIRYAKLMKVIYIP
jgi:hypothetical protein